MSTQPSVSIGTELELWIAVVSRLYTVEGRYHVIDCMEPALSNFNYSNKKYDRGGKSFQPIHILKAGICTVMEFSHM
jgi:hypothetical protein